MPSAHPQVADDVLAAIVATPVGECVDPKLERPGGVVAMAKEILRLRAAATAGHDERDVAVARTERYENALKQIAGGHDYAPPVLRSLATDALAPPEGRDG